MNAITIVMVVFSMLGALDRIFGNRFGLGKEFERGFMLLGTLALSMIGMIVISPWIAQLLQPVSAFMAQVLHMDPSILPASLFANDMGGAALASAVAAEASVGRFNALVVSSMMGCTVSFTIPYALSAVAKQQHRQLLLGLLYGIAVIPVGCLVGGLVLGLPFSALLWNMLPLVLFSALIVVGLMLRPEVCLKLFGLFGALIKIIITVGLALAILRFLTGIELIEGLATLEEGAAICLNAAAVMTGAFPLLYVLSLLLAKPLRFFGQKTGLNESAVMGLLATLANSVTAFESMKDMNAKGVMLNAAFAVGAAFTFADHLAFTMAFDASCIAGMIAGKLTAGVLALILANAMYRRHFPSET